MSQRYNIREKVLDTDKNGIPQNRPRVYIIGILKEIDTGNFEWPEDIVPCHTARLLNSRDQYLACTGTLNEEAKIANKMSGDSQKR